MNSSNYSYLLLRGLIAFGGLFEAVMGVIILFWGDSIIIFATQMQIVPNYSLYWRTMGLLAIALGSLQIVASYQPKRYVMVPIVACFVRFVLPVLTIIQIFEAPSMTSLLIFSTVFDFLLAAATFFLLFHNELLWKKSSD
ncbi:MAG: hypothetical protein ACFFDI_14520 [Promethearchaeota archaeon]